MLINERQDQFDDGMVPCIMVLGFCANRAHLSASIGCGA
jgi:hypothetical protein